MPTKRRVTKPKKRKEPASLDEGARLPWESVPDGMYRIRGPHGTIEFLSAAFELLTGWSVDAWVGRSFAELVHPEDMPKAVARYQATCRGESLPPFELRVRTQGGDFRLGEVHSAPLVENGAVVGEIGVVRDITGRRSAERALRESEARFRLLLEAALEGIGILEEGRVIDCNEDLAAMLGYTRDEIIGRAVSDFVAPEDVDSVAERVRGGPSGPSDQRARRKDGSTLHVEVQGRPLPYQGRQLRVVAIRDNTERRRSELIQRAIFRISEAAHTALSLQELFAALHRIVGELMPARNFYIALYDAETDTLSFPYFVDQYDDTPAPKQPGRGLTEYVLRTGRPLLATPEVSRELEHRGEVDLIGAPSLDWLGVPLVAAGKTTGILVVQTYEEGVRYTKGDRDLLKFVSAEIAMAVERKRAEQALRESEEQFRQLVEHIHDALIRDDTAGNITFANDQFLALFGFERSQVPRLTLSDYVAPEWLERLRERHDRRLRGETVPATYEFEGLRHDGRRLWLEVDVAPLKDRSGHPIGTQSAIRDISERKALEAQLRQAQKMEAVGHLAGGIAHDFNNLLTTILAAHELLATELPADGAHLEDLETIRQAARRAAELTRNLLAFSRQQAVELQAVPLGGLVEDFARLARRIVPEDIDVTVQVEAPSSVVRADAGAVEQMLMNLVTNSRDAMPSGGALRFTVGLAVLDEDSCRAHGWGLPGDYVTLTVADTGRGMDHQTLQHVFEPFFTTKPVGQGTGLGLAMVYGLVKQHHGFINVYSEPGLGTTVRIYFPAVAEAPVPKAAVTASGSRGGRETILLVEDDATLRRTATRVLERFGYVVITATDGLDALDIVRSRATPPDLIISDVVMPHASGPQLLSALRETGAPPRVLFTSGYAARDVQERSLLDRGVPFLAKPWSIAELLRKVREVLDAPPPV